MLWKSLRDLCSPAVRTTRVNGYDVRVIALIIREDAQPEVRMQVGKMSTAARSRIMSAIRKRDTKPEIAVRRYLHAKGLRYRLYGAKLPGNPDLVFASRKAVVFVHGCFWHRCPHCPAGSKVVRSNIAYWHPKLKRNVVRDAWAQSELQAQGWTALTIWECQTREVRQLQRLTIP